MNTLKTYYIVSKPIDEYENDYRLTTTQNLANMYIEKEGWELMAVITSTANVVDIEKAMKKLTTRNR